MISLKEAYVKNIICIVQRQQMNIYHNKFVHVMYEKKNYKLKVYKI